MLGAQPPDTRVLEVAGPATQHACSAARGWRLGVCFSCWLPCLALGGRDTRDNSLITGEDLSKTSPPPQVPAL